MPFHVMWTAVLTYDHIHVESEEMSNMDDEVDCALLDTIRQYQNSIIKHSELGNDAKVRLNLILSFGL